MQMVISQAWTPDEDNAARYVAMSEAFEDFYRAQSGYIARFMVRGIEDRSHFVHIRLWASIDDYTAMTQIPEYQAHIAALSEHVDAERYTDGYPREFTDVVFSSASL